MSRPARPRTWWTEAASTGSTRTRSWSSRRGNEIPKGPAAPWLPGHRSCRRARRPHVWGSSALGGAGELDGRNLRRDAGALEHDLGVADVDDDRLARAELLPEQLLGQRVLDQALDLAPQRPGAERRVVALLG